MSDILEIKNLSVSFNTPQGELQAVRDVSFSLHKGEVLAIVGESGCGKSVLCKTIMKLLPKNAYIKSGNILIDGVDIADYSQKDMERLRGKVFSMVFQDPMTSLNPAISVGRQIAEAIKVHNPKMKKDAVYNRVIELMILVGISEPEYRYKLYPHNFSGGMCQRIVMAIALASEPEILFADEPTTSLDATIQTQILDLLKDIQKKARTAVVLVSHDLGVVARVADRVLVMYAGKIVETGTAEDIFYNPHHLYTCELIRSLPYFAFSSAKNNPQKTVQDKGLEFNNDILLDVQHLSHYFKLGKNAVVKAVDDLSFQIRRGEIFGLVGESGSGKSTVARCIMNVCRPFSGKILYKGINVCDRRQFYKNKKMLQTSRQMIFQDSTSSLNAHMSVADIIAEPMQISHIKPLRGSFRGEAQFQLYYVGMDKSYLDKYPAELSGGMRQRVAIARALSMEPELLVADEPVASLDVSIQAQIINLFKHLQAEHGFSFLFIAHDLYVVKYLCDRVGVMYNGKLVEVASVKELFENPVHPYTKSLLSAVPIPEPQRERTRVLQEFDPALFAPDGKLVEISHDHMVLEWSEK